jgi:hypothetical protein
LFVLVFVFYFCFFGASQTFALNDDNIKQYAVDVPWLGSMYRMHGFRTTASPVWGLTADVLVCAPHFCPFATFFPFFLAPDFPA